MRPGVWPGGCASAGRTAHRPPPSSPPITPRPGPTLRPGPTTHSHQEAPMLVIAIETGSGASARWAGRRHDDDWPDATSGASPAELFDAVFHALHDGEQVALGLDCPLTVPAPADHDPAAADRDPAAADHDPAAAADGSAGLADLGYLL